MTAATSGTPASRRPRPPSTASSAGTASATRASPASARACARQLLMFVPQGHTAEVHELRIKNTTAGPKSLKVFSFIEWCLWNAYDDMTNYQRNFSTGEVEIERGGSTIYHKTEYRERRDHYAFYNVNADGRRVRHRPRDLLRPLQRLERARRRAQGRLVQLGRQRLVAHRLARPRRRSRPRRREDLRLHPRLRGGPARREVGEARRHQQEAGARADREVLHAGAGRRGDEGARDHWSRLLSNYSIESTDEKLNRTVNIWNPYQCMVTFNMSRSASYFETGIGRGMGFRDSNQDLLGFVHLVPERARERIIDIASTQFPDGSAYHQYQPLTKRGNNDVGSGFNDDPLWLIFGVGRLHSGDRRLRDPRRAGAVRQRSQDQDDAVRAPEALVQLHAQQPGAARAAAHRPRRLERLPQPELLLRDAGRVVPDDRQQDRPHGRVGVHRRHVRGRGARLRRTSPRSSASPTRRRRRGPNPRR